MRVLITGAGRGIGRGLADACRAKGYDVTGTARGAGAGDATLDVTDPASFKRLHTVMGDRPIQLLVCNAGVYLDKGQRLDDGFAADQWADTFAANVAGVFHTVQTFLPNLRAARGKIAIIGSQMGGTGRAPGGSYIYRASKAAVLNLGRNIAADLRSDGVAVGIYHPGWVRTDMGGTEADISVDESVAGLMARFAELSMDTSGCFRSYDGTDLLY